MIELTDSEKLLQEAGLASCVKEICIIESKEPSKKEILPFYADGFPGIMYQHSGGTAKLLPSQKSLTNFFLYGQTLNPIKIEIESPYKIIVFQLYPFSAKALFGIDTRNLNDECYDLHLVEKANTKASLELLRSNDDSRVQVKAIAEFIRGLVEKSYCPAEIRIQRALQLILESRGAMSVKSLTEHLNITERTLQRLFIEYVGISPKQFSKIIRFKFSTDLISQDAYTNFTDVVYESGYADQSHFIRNFRKFTGLNPSEYKTLK